MNRYERVALARGTGGPSVATSTPNRRARHYQIETGFLAARLLLQIGARLELAS